MNMEASLRSFLGWIVAGMGLHVGWGLITLVVELIARALAQR